MQAEDFGMYMNKQYNIYNACLLKNDNNNNIFHLTVHWAKTFLLLNYLVGNGSLSKFCQKVKLLKLMCNNVLFQYTFYYYVFFSL